MTQDTVQFDSTIPVADERAETNLHLGWRIFITLLLLLLVALLSVLLQPARPASSAPLERPALQSTSDPLVLALYYSWFDEQSWSPATLSDLPAEPYASRDRGVMGRHIDQAKAAGIDAFVVAWYGPSGDTNQTEGNLRALLEEAAARNFKISVLFETDSPFLGGTGAIAGALEHLLNVHGSHPAYLRADGRPVIFFWRPALYGVGTWSAIRGQVDPAYNSLWVSEGVDTSLLAVFDGHYLYSNTWNPPADLQATQQKFAGLVEAARHATGAGKLWVATVMPGYNDVKIRPGYGFATDREGGAYYARSWQAAITSHPNWIVITSFNEWPEGTYIEPSQAYGDLYLGLTAGWSSQFKAGGGTAALPAPVEAPDSPTAFVQTQLLNLRAGPSVDHALMGQVPAGAALPIVGRTPGGDWWQVESDQGVVWVFGELVRASGPLDDVPEVETTPAPLGSANAGEDEPDADAATEGNHPAVEDDTAVDAARAAAPGGFTLTIGDETYTVHSVRSTAP